jgi:hypothetical protein
MQVRFYAQEPRPPRGLEGREPGQRTAVVAAGRMDSNSPYVSPFLIRRTRNEV